MSEIVLRRIPSRIIACFDVSQWGRGDFSRGLQDKSADCRRTHLVGWVGVSRSYDNLSAAASHGSANGIKASPAVALWKHWFCRHETPIR